VDWIRSGKRIREGEKIKGKKKERKKERRKRKRRKRKRKEEKKGREWPAMAGQKPGRRCLGDRGPGPKEVEEKSESRVQV